MMDFKGSFSANKRVVHRWRQRAVGRGLGAKEILL